MNLLLYRRVFSCFNGLFVFWLSTALYCQTEYKVERITIDDGLAHDFVYCLMQDSKGCMWFGTADGLNKYGGGTLRSYRHDPSDSASLSFSAVTSIAEDSAGNIWAGSNYGMNRLNRYSGKVRRVFVRSELLRTRGKAPGPILLVHTSGAVWLATLDSLYRYRAGRDIFEAVIPIEHFEAERSYRGTLLFTEAADGALWIGTEESLVRYHPESNSCERIKATQVIDDFGFLQATIGVESCREAVWPLPSPFLNYVIYLEKLKGRSGLSALLPAAEWRLAHQLTCRFLDAGEEDSHWLIVEEQQGTFSGVYRLRQQNDAPQAAPEQILAGSVHSWHITRDSILWLGSEEGVYSIKRVLKPFRNFRHHIDDPHSLSHSRIRCIHKDRRDNIWVGTDRGLNRLDDASGRWHQYFPGPILNDSCAPSIVNTIFEDSNGRLLLGTCCGIRHYRPELDRFDYGFGQGEPEEFPNRVWAIARDSDNNLWVGSDHNGLWRYGADGGPVQRFYQGKDDSLRICNDRVWTLFADSRNNFWIGTHNGLNRWLPNKGHFKQYRHDKADSSSICGNDIWWISEDDAGRLWIAAYGFGLSEYDYDSDTFRNFTVANGLQSNGVFGALGDSRALLWIPSNVGLSLFDPARGRTLDTYDHRDGLPGRVFAYKAMHRAADGELFFGGLRGLTRFHPERIRRNSRPPAVLLASFSIFDSTARHELKDGERIRLLYQQNSLAFEFAILDYDNADKTSCAYMLQGLDKSWIYPREARTASYTNLKPGSYTLRVRGANGDGIWNLRGATVYIDIIPPFWQTLWFRTFSFVIIVLLLGSAVWLRTRRIRRTHSLERQALEAELQALRAQLNPHFIFNSLTSLQNLIQNDSPASATAYLGGVATLFRRVLEYSRFPVIRLEEELNFLEHYLSLEASRFGRRVGYQIDYDPGLDISSVMIPPMLLQPYVENAILHGLLPKPEGGIISIHFSRNQKSLCCRIEDNGVGRRTAEAVDRAGKTHRPMGTDLGRRHLAILARQGDDKSSVEYTDLLDDNGNAVGTRVVLNIRLQEGVSKV